MSGRQVKWYGDKAKNAARDGAVAGLENATDELLKLSQKEVPISPYSRGGFLRDTGQSAVDSAELVGAVSYDGASDTPGMAVYVHERMNIRHQTGRSKFLEGPLAEHQDALLKMIGERVKKELGG